MVSTSLYSTIESTELKLVGQTSYFGKKAAQLFHIHTGLFHHHADFSCLFYEACQKKEAIADGSSSHIKYRIFAEHRK